MSSILDVEFLRSPLPLSRSLIYRFRTGVLRHNLFLALEQMAPIGLQGCEPSALPQLMRGFGLFDFTYYCDLSSKDHQSSVDVANTLAALTEPGNRPVIVFAHERHGLFGHENWSAASANCIVIDEVFVTEQTLETILAYLEHTSDLLRVHCSDARLARMAYFREMLHQEGTLALPEFRNEFDNAVLLYTDRETGEFHAPVAADAHLSSRTSFFRTLRDLIEHGTASALSAFLQPAAALYHGGWAAREIADELCKVTRRLLEAQTPGRHGRRRPFHHALSFELSVLIWTSVLLTWIKPLIENEDREEKEPLGARLAVVLLDQIAREFLLRRDTQELGDPLAGLWLPLEAVIAPTFGTEFEEPNPRDRLIATLSSSLPAPAGGDRPWIARLRHILADPIARDSGPKQSKARAFPDWSPASFDRVYGNSLILHDLRKRFASESHAKPLLLYGADGIGKRTIARVYARTLLCEDRDEETWLTCGKCTTCLSFDIAGDIGLMQFDAAKDEAGDTAKEVLSKLRLGLYHRHRVVIVENPERSERAVDVLLKTLEEGVPETTFVLCVSDLKAMSATGQSRCTIHRVRPLEPGDSASLATEMLYRLGAQMPDAKALTLMVAAADGVPSDLQRICHNVAAAGAVSLDNVKRALDLDWIGSVLAYWAALVRPQGPALSELSLPSTVDPRTGVRRVRQVLSALHRTAPLTGSMKVVVTQSLAQQRDMIIGMLTERANELAVPYEELWSRLAQHWASSDHGEARAFLEAGIASRQIVSGLMADIP